MVMVPKCALSPKINRELHGARCLYSQEECVGLRISEVNGEDKVAMDDRALIKKVCIASRVKMFERVLCELVESDRIELRVTEF